MGGPAGSLLEEDRGYGGTWGTGGTGAVWLARGSLAAGGRGDCCEGGRQCEGRVQRYRADDGRRGGGAEARCRHAGGCAENQGFRARRVVLCCARRDGTWASRNSTRYLLS